MTLDDDKRAAIAEKLNALWTASKPAILERLTTLEKNFDAWCLNPQDSAALHAAHDAAHKLAGVLGTFGLQRGSCIASELEEIVTQVEAHSKQDIPAMLAELRQLITAKQ